VSDPRPKLPPLPPDYEFDDAVVRKGAPKQRLTDIYYELQRGSWWILLGLYVGGFLITNVVFSLLYLAGGDCIEGAESGSFADMFFFSVQTLATVGYGSLAPTTTYADLIVMIELMIGLLGLALGTGLALAKLARPRANMLFSRNVLLAPCEGRHSLYFRVANLRGNDVVEATVRVVALRSHTAEGGQALRRLHDLELVRANSPLFRFSWLVVHTIDERSPLAGLEVAAMIEDRVVLIVSLTGLDATFAQTVHARHVYTPHDLLTGHHFVDIVRDLGGGRIEVDFDQFHDVVPLSPLEQALGEHEALIERDAEAREVVAERASDGLPASK
jgi:inward rectifier potassium channel